MHNIWIITVKRDNLELGLFEGMSVEVPMPIGETPNYGKGREKVVRMFMMQYGVDIDVKVAWAPIFPSSRFLIEKIAVR